MANKALTLLKKAKTVDERSAKYAERIAESLNIDILIPLKKQINKMEDKIFDLENFSLDTNLNKGVKTMTQEDCENRFKEIIELDYQKTILELEYKVKLKSFDALFNSEVEE